MGEGNQARELQRLRFCCTPQSDGEKGWAAWVAGREEQWRGIVYSDLIFAVGFAIFALSDFLPTQRFGLVILFGLVIDILANLLPCRCWAARL
jgi:hypothetical protein